MTFDIERLREDLMNYFGTAIHSGNDVAIMNLVEVENASGDELIQIAQKYNDDFDISDYIIED